MTKKDKIAFDSLLAENTALLNFINREMKMTATDPRILRLESDLKSRKIKP